MTASVDLRRSRGSLPRLCIALAFTAALVAPAARGAATIGTLSQPAGPAGCVAGTFGGPCVFARAFFSDAVSVAVSPDGRTVYTVSDTFRDKEQIGIAVLSRSGPTDALEQPAGSGGCLL